MRLIPVLVLAAVIGACAHSPSGSSDHPASQIRLQRQQMNNLFSERRLPEIVDYLAKDIQFVTLFGTSSGTDEFVHGHQALLLERPDLLLTFTPDSIEHNQLWQLAAESGHWYESWREDGDYTELRGSYYAVWKLQDGQWRLYSHVFVPLSCKGTTYCRPRK